MMLSQRPLGDPAGARHSPGTSLPGPRRQPLRRPPPAAARAIATMLWRTASRSAGHAATTAARSASCTGFRAPTAPDSAPPGVGGLPQVSTESVVAETSSSPSAPSCTFVQTGESGTGALLRSSCPISAPVPLSPFTGSQSRLSLRESDPSFAERKATFHAKPRACRERPVSVYVFSVRPRDPRERSRAFQAPSRSRRVLCEHHCLSLSNRSCEWCSQSTLRLGINPFPRGSELPFAAVPQ